MGFVLLNKGYIPMLFVLVVQQLILGYGWHFSAKIYVCEHLCA